MTEAEKNLHIKGCKLVKVELLAAHVIVKGRFQFPN